MRRLYWDACVFIYRVEAVAPWANRIARAMTSASPAIIGVTELTRLECRVQPLRNGNRALLDLFEHFLASPAMLPIPMTRGVFDLAATLRAGEGLRTADALHLASALGAGCDEFWTNDERLAKAAAGRIAIVNINTLP